MRLVSELLEALGAEVYGGGVTEWSAAPDAGPAAELVFGQVPESREVPRGHVHPVLVDQV